MEFIPTPPIGIVEVVLREDYRYGMVDPIQWPQLYSTGYEYLCALQRRREAPHPLARLWWTPEEGKDFQLLQGCTMKTLGLLRVECVRELSGMVDDLVAEVVESERRRMHVVDDRVLWLTTAMRHVRDRLRNFACTFRDAAMQVREVQRYWLMTRAYLDYYGTYIRLGWRSNHLNTDLMGAFTTDPGVVQNLYEAGIPVWFVRQDASLLKSTVVYELTKMEPPRGITVNAGPQHGAVLYRGLVGRKHLEVMARGGHTYLDISRAPLLIVETAGGYAAPVSHKQYRKERSDQARTAEDTTTQRNGVRGPSNKRATNRDGRGYHPCKSIWNIDVPYADPLVDGPKVSGRPQARLGAEKFEELSHRWMPPALPAWRQALDSVDLSHVGPTSRKSWGYWIPEPGLFVRTKTDQRGLQYIMNWLRVRPAWLYMLRVRDANLCSIPPQWWRDFLYGDLARSEGDRETRKSVRARQVLHVFNKAFQLGDVDVNPAAPPSWFDRRYDHIPENVCGRIIWEICELGFRQELLAMDRILVPMSREIGDEEMREDFIGRVFADGALYHVERLPEDTGCGLSDDLCFRRVPYLEAFRNVLCRWPRCPPCIHKGPSITTSMSREVIEEKERQMARFYVQRFYEESSRAPIVPRRFPTVA